MTRTTIQTTRIKVQREGRQVIHLRLLRHHRGDRRVQDKTGKGGPMGGTVHLQDQAVSLLGRCPHRQRLLTAIRLTTATMTPLTWDFKCQLCQKSVVFPRVPRPLLQPLIGQNLRKQDCRPWRRQPDQASIPGHDQARPQFQHGPAAHPLTNLFLFGPPTIQSMGGRAQNQGR